MNEKKIKYLIEVDGVLYERVDVKENIEPKRPDGNYTINKYKEMLDACRDGREKIAHRLQKELYAMGFKYCFRCKKIKSLRKYGEDMRGVMGKNNYCFKCNSKKSMRIYKNDLLNRDKPIQKEPVIFKQSAESGSNILEGKPIIESGMVDKKEADSIIRDPKKWRLFHRH